MGPHFLVSKRMNVATMSILPCIYDYGVCPKVSAFKLEYSTDILPVDARRINLFACSRCYSTEDTVLDSRSDLLICQHCGNTCIPSSRDDFTRASRKLYRPRKYSDNFYKREVHFRNWLARLQGKERRRVPGFVVDQVKACMAADNIKQTNYWVIRGILKRLKLTRYYANVNQIGNLVRGHPACLLSASHEKELIRLFLSLRDVYEQISDERVNMLHYPYVIRKLCEHKGWFRMACSIPLLKSPSRIQVLDTLWKRICKIKGWNFQVTALHSRLDTRSPYSTRI
jgi:hypothetical protein